jgi:hypothetical protein
MWFKKTRQAVEQSVSDAGEKISLRVAAAIAFVAVAVLLAVVTVGAALWRS